MMVHRRQHSSNQISEYTWSFSFFDFHLLCNIQEWFKTFSSLWKISLDLYFSLYEGTIYVSLFWLSKRHNLVLIILVSIVLRDTQEQAIWRSFSTLIVQFSQNIPSYSDHGFHLRTYSLFSIPLLFSFFLLHVSTLLFHLYGSFSFSFFHLDPLLPRSHRYLSPHPLIPLSNLQFFSLSLSSS